MLTVGAGCAGTSESTNGGGGNGNVPGAPVPGGNPAPGVNPNNPDNRPSRPNTGLSANDQKAAGVRARLDNVNRLYGACRGGVQEDLQKLNDFVTVSRGPVSALRSSLAKTDAARSALHKARGEQLAKPPLPAGKVTVDGLDACTLTRAAADGTVSTASRQWLACLDKTPRTARPGLPTSITSLPIDDAMKHAEACTVLRRELAQRVINVQAVVEGIDDQIEAQNREEEGLTEAASAAALDDEDAKLQMLEGVLQGP